jgi:hypothetical protein
VNIGPRYPAFPGAGLCVQAPGSRPPGRRRQLVRGDRRGLPPHEGGGLQRQLRRSFGGGDVGPR